MIKVLLIDDDHDDAEIFADALRGLAIGTVFEYFVDGAKALEKLTHDNGKPPDIIFLDINMPVINGWECLRELKDRASLQQIPIIMYSTWNPEKEGIVSSDIGATAFMTKPNTLRELKATLNGLFERLFPQK